MKQITINRADFRVPEDGDADFFADIVIELGLSKDYDSAAYIDTVIVTVDSAVIDE